MVRIRATLPSLRSPAGVIALAVAVSFVLRLVETIFQDTPTLFPDEYIYVALARSIGSTGQPLIRGASAHFPALLTPAITAPFWWISNTVIAYHAVMGFGALCMSLGAVPVYLLARRAGVSTKLSVAIAIVSLLSPDFMYVTNTLAEPFAYPLALTALYFSVTSIAEPRWRNHAGFVVFSALAIAARLQFVVIPATYVLAVAAYGLRTRELREAARSRWFPLVVCLLPPALAVVAGPSRFLGYYKGALHLNASPIDYLASTGRELLVLGYISGWVLIPGALIALGLALYNPRTKGELAFTSVASIFTVGILAEAAIYGAAGRVQERYFFYLVPLILIAWGTYTGRGWPLKPLHAALSGVLLLTTFAAPVQSFVGTHTSDGSPFLLGLTWAMQTYYLAGSALLIVILFVATLVVLSVGLIIPRAATRVALCVAAALSLTFAVASASFEYTNAAGPARERTWIDAHHDASVTVIVDRDTRRLPLLAQLFWNRSLNRVALFPDGHDPDAFSALHAGVRGDGSLLIDGKLASNRALLFDELTSYYVLYKEISTERANGWVLYPPRSHPRLELYETGRLPGYLGVRGQIEAWPQQDGFVELRVTGDADAKKTSRLAWVIGQHGTTKSFTLAVPPGVTKLVRIPVCSGARMTATFKSQGNVLAGATLLIDDNLVSVHASNPKFVPGPVPSCSH